MAVTKRQIYAINERIGSAQDEIFQVIGSMSPGPTRDKLCEIMARDIEPAKNDLDYAFELAESS